MKDNEALAFAAKHVATWNAHEIDSIMALYSDAVELVSPLASTLTGGAAVQGKPQLREYFARALAQYPDLRFELVDTFLCHTSITLLFKGAGGRLVAEVMFLGPDGKIERVYAHYLVAHGTA